MCMPGLQERGRTRQYGARSGGRIPYPKVRKREESTGNGAEEREAPRGGQEAERNERKKMGEGGKEGRGVRPPTSRFIYERRGRGTRRAADVTEGRGGAEDRASAGGMVAACPQSPTSYAHRRPLCKGVGPTTSQSGICRRSDVLPCIHPVKSYGWFVSS